MKTNRLSTLRLFSVTNPPKYSPAYRPPAKYHGRAEQRGQAEVEGGPEGGPAGGELPVPPAVDQEQVDDDDRGQPDNGQDPHPWGDVQRGNPPACATP
ncbi:hypothetical protein [Actinomadura keratinilytica]|uniref:hypothetical protein n=1 Tax=Actinomadura keratinilytica TaxID=547461 RepID=UPI00361DD612